MAIPLLVGAELVVHRRMRLLVKQFLERNLIPESAMPRFDAAIHSAFRLRNSTLAEVLLLAVVYGLGILVIWRHYMALDAATWFATPTAEGSSLSLAGMWYAYLSLPIFQFLLLALVFPPVYLDALSLAGVAHRIEPGPDASGPHRWPGIFSPARSSPSSRC